MGKLNFFPGKVLYNLLQPVDEILLSGDNTVSGVMLEDGSEVRAGVVLSNATPKVTFMDLLPGVNGAEN